MARVRKEQNQKSLKSLRAQKEKKLKKYILNLCAKIEKAIRKYETGNSQKSKEWRSLDKVLHETCDRFPLHNKKNHIFAKVVVVDRLYEAGLYRQGKKYDKVVQKLYNNSNKINSQLSKLKKQKNLKVSIIPEVAGLVNSLTKVSNSVFPTKYFHFHLRNIFPIADQHAKSHLAEISKKLELKLPKTGIRYSEYGKFCFRILRLQQIISSKCGKHYSLAELDKYLYGECK